MNVEHELRATSDTMLATLDELARLENEKRGVTPDSPQFLELARAVEQLAGDLFSQTHRQERLGQTIQAKSASETQDIPPIEDIEVARELPVILSEWREAERELAAAKPRSATHARLAADVSRLRAEYQRAYAAQKREPKD